MRPPAASPPPPTAAGIAGMIRSVTSRPLTPRIPRHPAPLLRLAAGLLAASVAMPTAPSAAQVSTVILPGRGDESGAAGGTVRRIPITGDRLSGIVLPMAPQEGPIRLEALRVDRWQVDDTRRLLLRGDVDVRIAGHRFQASTAVVWINRLPTAEGVVSQIAVWFDEVRNPERPSGVGVAGRQLLVTGAVRGEVSFLAPRVVEGRPANNAAIRSGEERLRRYLVSLQTALAEGTPPSLSPVPEVRPPAADPAAAADDAAVTDIELPEVSARRPWLRAPGATISFSAARLELQTDPVENRVLATGGLVVEYFADDDAAVPSQLTLTATRAVIFTEPGAVRDLARRSLDAGAVRGIYLEGDVRAVADRGEQVLRAPRVYYDFATGRAIMLEAVLRTFARDVQAPVYARAAEMRQIAEDQFAASDVRVSASEYAIGHLSIGAERMVLEQRPVAEPPAAGDVPAALVAGREDAARGTWLDARDITMNLGTTPILFWPRFRGRIQDVPLRGVSLGLDEQNGVEIETRWDLQALAGVERTPGLDAELSVDGYTDRGAGAGLVLRSTGADPGRFEAAYLYDDGEDRTGAGRTVDQDQANRGIVLYEQRIGLSRDWSLALQGSSLSDPTFAAEWREEDFSNRREYETSARLAWQRRHQSFAVETAWRPDDFISNGWLLASPGYTVDRMPEVRYAHVADSLLDGRVTSHMEARYGRVRMRFVDRTPAELGIRPGGFGLANDDLFSELAWQAGLESAWVHRADVRQEFSVPFDLGPVRVAPFAIGRVTALDDDFSRLSPQQTDSVRVWGGLGVRASTRVQRIFDGVRSMLLDLDRLRWTIEPSITAMYSEADIDQLELPEFDSSVESLATGATVELGLRNVFQTHRGGPGRSRSVDVLRLDTRLVAGSSDLDRESVVPRFIGWRPELSQAGDHLRQTAAWRISDSVAMTAEGVYDLEDDLLARSAFGVSVTHSPLLRTYLEYRRLDASETELLELGWQYRLSPTYSVLLRPTWDLQTDDFRAVNLTVTRRFPDVDLRVSVNYDEFRDETSFGTSLGFTSF